MAAEHSPSTPIPPSLVAAFQDRYELIREAGHGGSATVYLARDLKHDRSVAVKVLNGDVGKLSGERFVREIRVSARMQHPNILPTYDSGIVDGRRYFVMPHVDGGSLRDLLNAKTSLPVGEALLIARQVAVALAHAHAQGIIHRDVKPENIMFYHGTACLADFGIARLLEELEPGITEHGTLVGTPGYMSPEQFLTGFDGRSDIYSLSCVLYEMIAGSRLFSGNTPQELVERRSYLLAKSRELGPTLPGYVDALLDRGLARAPHHRFNDANEFVAALDDALDKAERPERDSAARRAITSIRRRKVEFAMVAVAVALIGVAVWPKLREGMARQRIMQQGAASPVSRTPFATGKAALEAWNIPLAQTELAAAVAADPTNVAARLWLAQSYVLARRSGREDFRVAARQLESHRADLSGRDSLLAEGLIALAAGRPAAACNAYRSQLHRDTLDVLAWYGMGDCRSLDTTVVRDRRSPSGWSFVSSFESAAHAYRRAIELAPAAHAAVPFSLMTRLLAVNPTSLRRGRAIPEGPSFVALPALINDTVAFIPYPIARFQSSAPAELSPTQPLALERNQETLLAFAQEWVQSFRGSADAWEALAQVRELRGELAAAGDGAAAALNNARNLATTPAQRLRLAAAQVRLHVKEGDFRRARLVSDSVLEAVADAPVDTEAAETLAGLAALTGRVGATAKFHIVATAAEHSNRGVAPPLAEAGSRFFARAAPGVCDDSLRILRRDFERLLDSYATPNRRQALRQMVTWQSGALSFPCLKGDAVRELTATTALAQAQREFISGNMKQVREILDSVATARAGYRPGDVALDFTVQEAWLRSAAGYGAAAEHQLDLVLDALPTLSTRTSVTEPGQSAAIGRAMVLRAEMATSRGDDATAKRWAKNVVELWANADASLQPTVQRMKTIAR